MADNAEQQLSTVRTPADGATAAGDGRSTGGAQAQANGHQPAGDAQGNGKGDGNTNGGGGARGGLLRNPIFLLIAAIVVIGGIVWAVRFHDYSQTHASTDDAYVTGDLVNVSPIISGTLKELYVQEGDQVKAGQLIARLDDSGPLASYHQALAAYEAAVSEVPQAQTNLIYQKQSVAAQISQAQAGLKAQGARTDQARYQVALTQATLRGQISQAQAQYASAQAQAKSESAKVASAQANAIRTKRDLSRYAALYGKNGSVAAVTAQQYDAAVAAANQAAADLSAAQQSYAASEQQVSAYEAQLAIARSNQLQIPVQESNVVNNLQTASQAQAELASALAGDNQVTLRQQQVLTAIAEARQARAALANAKVTLQDTYIYAPADGTVVRKAANVGDSLVPGQTIATVTQSNSTWLEANFKETQLAGIKPGQTVEVTVDALPNLTFLGKVQSINQASGNVTALLPAENATGNFTKVVQRIPVKILFTPAKPGNNQHYATAADIANLRQGMSAEPTVDISSQ